MSLPEVPRGKFFNWIDFGFGLIVVAIVVAAVYFGWSGTTTFIIIGIVVLAIAGIYVLRVKAKLRKLEDGG